MRRLVIPARKTPLGPQQRQVAAQHVECIVYQFPGDGQIDFFPLVLVVKRSLGVAAIASSMPIGIGVGSAISAPCFSDSAHVGDIY